MFEEAPHEQPQAAQSSSVNRLAVSSTSETSSSSADAVVMEVVTHQSEGQALQRNADFTELLDYSLSTKPPLENPLWSFAMLTPVALASMWMYVRPSWEAGQAEGGLPMAILQLLGNTGGAGLIVYNIGGHYLGLIKASRDALRYLKTHGLVERKTFDEINGCLEKCYRIFAQGGKAAIKKLQESKLDILTIATIISFPLAAAALFYRDYDKEPEWLLLTKAAVTLAVNTLIHTLPVSFILNVYWLNTLLIKLPIAPFTFMRYLYRKCAWSQEEQIQYRLEQQLTLEQKTLRSHMMNGLYSLVAQIQKFGFERRGCRYLPKLPSEIQALLSKAKRQELGEQDIPLLLSLLPAIADFYAAPTVSHSQRSTLCSFLEYLNSWLQKVAGLAGAVLVGSSVAGYAAVNGRFYEEKLGSQAGAIVLMMPTVIAMEVLCGYFGWVAFAGAYEFIANLVTCRPQMPYVFKLSPLLSGFFLATTWCLGYFGYGTALQLVHDTFDPKVYGQVLCDLLAISAKYGIIVYAFINFAQLVEKLVEPVVKWKCCGSPETQQYLFMLDSLKRMAALIDELKPELLQEILNTIKDPSILKTFGLERAAAEERGVVTEIVKPVPSVSAANTSSAANAQSWCGWVCSFFGGRYEKSEEATEHQPLLVGANLGSV